MLASAITVTALYCLSLDTFVGDTEIDAVRLGTIDREAYEWMVLLDGDGNWRLMHLEPDGQVCAYAAGDWLDINPLVDRGDDPS